MMKDPQFFTEITAEYFQPVGRLGQLLEFFLILMTTKNFTHPEKGIKNHKHAVIPQSPALTKVTET